MCIISFQYFLVVGEVNIVKANLSVSEIGNKQCLFIPGTKKKKEDSEEDSEDSVSIQSKRSIEASKDSFVLKLSQSGKLKLLTWFVLGTCLHCKFNS